MGNSVEFRLNTTDVVKGINFFWRGARKAIPRAVNKTARSARAGLVKSVSKDMNLRSKDVRERIRIVPAKPGREQAFLVPSSERIPLVKFKARGPEPSRGKGRGVSYRLPGGRGRIREAFIVTLGSGKRGVFIRTGPGRTPITELHGPSVARVFVARVPAAMRSINDTLQKNLRSELRFAFRGRAG